MAPNLREAELGWPGGGGGQGGDRQVWADLRTAGVGDWSADSDDEDLSGPQFNALLGVTHRIGDNLLVGLLGGYERFDYNSDTLDADLDGDGWTIGGYVGGRIAERLRFHAAAGYSGIGLADSTAGTADGSFDANRWIVTAGCPATWRCRPSWSSRRWAPSAFGNARFLRRQPRHLPEEERDFDTGRVSAGAKIPVSARDRLRAEAAALCGSLRGLHVRGGLG